MWTANGNNIQMAEGDYGIDLPITISGVTLGASDSIKITIAQGETALIEKEFTDIQKNTVQLSLTQSESALLPVGVYVYSVDWYQDGAFLCNIIPVAIFKVGDKV